MCRLSLLDAQDSSWKDDDTKRPPHKYTVVYNSENHWEVLTQRLGSIRPKVLPYCIVNVILMLAVRLMQQNKSDLGMTLTWIFTLGKYGYNFMKFLVAFLVVTRVKLAFDRYNEARANIGILYRESRELIQNTVVFSDDQLDRDAKEWRMEMAYRTLLLLRTAMATLNFSVREEKAWELPELNGREKQLIHRSLLIYPENMHYAIDPNTDFEETMRVPILLSRMLAETVTSQSRRLQKPLQMGKEMKLLSSLDSFMAGYHGLRKFLTTPVPFPLIQLSRTFNFLYVFTIPFELLTDSSSVVAHAFFVFLITLGFIGLETVAEEIDDPFGDDPNDFNNLGLAATANEDTYLTILDVDGKAWADELRRRMRGENKSNKAGGGNDSDIVLSESTRLLVNPVGL